VRASPHSRILAAAGAVLLSAAIVLGVYLLMGGRSSAQRATPAVVVNGNPIPRWLVQKGVRIRFATTTRVPAPPGTPTYRAVQDQIVRQLVQDVTVVAEARRLGLVAFPGLVAVHVATHAAQTRALWRRLYDYAARGVPTPHDPKVVNAQGFNLDAYPGLLTARQIRVLDAWEARRDRVASVWFSALLRRYGARTWYAPGFRPAPG
jgi:hypothetical protein